MALGAGAADVAGLLVRRGMKLVAGGLLVGVLGAAAGARLLESLLFGVSPLEPVTYGTVITLLAAVALLACWLPARTAARVNPVSVLNEE